MSLKDLDMLVDLLEQFIEDRVSELEREARSIPQEDLRSKFENYGMDEMNDLRKTRNFVRCVCLKTRLPKKESP